MKHLFLLAAILPYLAQAALDRIDADGVTETGGTAAYARMLPRTKADGRLDASLLPPVADWASQPLPGLYYLSDGADHEGNGSPQYPFKTLTNAWAHAASGSAVLVAPGTYAGVVTLPSGQIRTLYGFGRSSFVQSLTVLSVGSATNELRLCGLRVGTLTLNGGPVTLSLQGATVGTLAGAASGITVARLDLGALVGASAVDYTDVHAGHQTVPKANRLVNPERTLQLDLTAGRGVVTATGGGTETLAYLSDLSTATNALGTEIRALAAEDVRLAGLVTSEASARRSSDAVLSNQTVAAAAVLQAQVDAIGTTWNAQAATLASGLSSVRSSLSTLSAKEADDVADLEDAIADVRADYAAADTTLAGTLRSETASAVSTLRADVPNIADTRANVQISLARPGIIRDAVAQAGTNATNQLTPITTRLTAAEGNIATLQGTVAGHTSTLGTLGGRTTALESGLAAAVALEASDVASLSEDIDDVRTDYAAADARIVTNLSTSISAQVAGVRAEIQPIADARALVQINNQKEGIIVTAVTRASAALGPRLTAAESAVTQLQTDLGTLDGTVTTLSGTVSGLNSTVSGHTTSLSSLQGTVTSNYNSLNGRINTLSGEDTTLQNNINAVDGKTETNKAKINEIVRCLQAIKSGTSWNAPTEIP